MFRRRASSEPITPGSWQDHPVNATRQSVSDGGYQLDVYEGVCSSSFELALERLFRYDIFPPHRMRARVCSPDGDVAVGTTIVQRVFLGPLALETAVRVIECSRGVLAGSFAYATTEGHPEQGIASFEVQRLDAQTRFVARAWSRPGNIAARLGRPVSRRLQQTFTREAVAHFCAPQQT